MKNRFEIGDTIYISNWFHEQPRGTVIKAKIVSKIDDCWLKWVKYEMVIDGGKSKFLIGDTKSPDVFEARIYKKSAKAIYKPRMEERIGQSVELMQKEFHKIN